MLCTDLADFMLIHLGLETIFIQSLPCSVVKMIAFIKRDILGYASNDPKNNPAFEFRNVTVFDARKQSPGTFDETGFTLIELDKVMCVFMMIVLFVICHFSYQRLQTGGWGLRMLITFINKWSLTS